MCRLREVNINFKFDIESFQSHYEVDAKPVECWFNVVAFSVYYCVFSIIVYLV